MSRKRSPHPGRISRRSFLRRVGYSLPVAAGAGGMAACGSSGGPGGDSDGGSGGGAVAFRHGVASGDPLADRVILWTRVSGAASDVPVTLEIARDPEMSDLVATRQGLARAARDFTVKIDADGLEPGTSYYYRFGAGGVFSPVGRTRTAPAGGVDRLRFGVVSCSSLAHGFFNAYRLLARRADIDCVLHLGDYIYEFGNGEFGDVRDYEPPTEILTLSDYRTRYAQYRRDPDLAELHRQHPMIAVWDDHETTDNSWRDNAKNHTEETAEDAGEGCWVQRKAWAIQAYREWMPIRDNLADYIAPESCADDRDPARVEAQERIWRRFAFGDLVELVMLDTRLYNRDIMRRPNVVPGMPADTESGNTNNDTQDIGLFANCAPPYTQEYSNLGDLQEDFLAERLRTSPARWKLLGQQVMFGQLKVLGLPEAGCSVPSTTEVLGLLENTSPDGPLAQILGEVSRQLPTVSTSSLYLNGDQWDGYPMVRQRIFELIDNEGVDNVVVLTGDIHTSWAMDLTPDPNNPAAYNPVNGEGSRAVELVTTSVTSPGLEPLDALADGLRLNNPHIKFVDLAQRGYMVLDITAERCQSEWYFVDTILDPAADGESVGAVFFTGDGDNRLTEGDAPAEPPAIPPPPAP